jgi:plastocyanin
LISVLLLFGCATPQEATKEEIPKPEPTSEVKEIKTPHFVDSSPMDGEIYAIAPSRVVINFNFDVVPPSRIEVFLNGKKVSGETIISDDRLEMEAPLGTQAGDGLYEVRYMACWPDRTCHEGAYKFLVDSSERKDYVDMTGKKDITVKMNGLRFEPRNMIVSKGARVTFVNEDPDEHFVNSDPHPTHNFEENFNSRGIGKGGNYSYVFNEPGEIHYHCSAHTLENMYARIIVADDTALPVTEAVPEKEKEPEEVKEIMMDLGVNQLRAPHFVSSSPAHKEVVTTTPDKVTIEFNFNLHQKSSITVTHDGKTVSGDTSVINKLTLETPLNYDGDGVYEVDYSACWPDGSCHDGQFGFFIDTG